MFSPGRVVTEFTTTDGQQVSVRYPRWEDLEAMTAFINELSKEDTFLTFSGETIHKDGEMYYLAEMFKSMELGNSIYLACFINNSFVASSTVIRDGSSRKRSAHVGIFGITVAAPFRGKGIGEKLATTTMEEAKKQIRGLKMFTLNVYSPNEIAQSLYRKIGFQEAGRIPKSILFHGEYVDEVKMYLPFTSHE